MQILCFAMGLKPIFHCNAKTIHVGSLRWLKPIFHCDTKPLALGFCVGLHLQRDDFVLPIPTCWYLKTRKLALPPTPNLKFALPPTRNPNESEWNIGCNIFALAMYISFFWCRFYLRWVPFFSGIILWTYGKF